MPALPNPKAILPVQTGVQAQEEEQSNGLTIFFSLLVIGRLPFIVFISISNNGDQTGCWVPTCTIQGQKNYGIQFVMDIMISEM